MIVDAYLTGLLPPGNGQQGQTPAASGDDAFQSVMDRTGKTERPVEPRQRAEKSERATNKERTDRSSDSRKPQKSREPAEKATRDTGKEASDAQKTTSETAEVKTEKPVESKKPLKQTEDEFKSKLAQGLNMTVEELEQLMANLGLQLVDLFDADKLNLFMQAAFAVESPAGLLNVPGISETFAETNALLTEFAELPQLTAEATGDTGMAVEETETALDSLEMVPETVNAIDAPETATQTAGPVLQTDTAAQTQVAAVGTTVVVDSEPEPVTVDNDQVSETSASTEVETPVAVAQSANAELAGGNAEGEMGDMPNSEPGPTPVDVRSTPEFTRSIAQAQQPTRTANTQEIVNQLLDRMRAEVRAGVSEVRITLRPESLGDVTMRLATQNGVLTAQFTAESQRVKEVIEANFDRLREALQERGLDVANLEVEVGQGDRNMEEFMQAQQRTTRRIRDIIDSVAAEEAEAEPTTTPENDSSVDYTA